MKPEEIENGGTYENADATEQREIVTVGVNEKGQPVLSYRTLSGQCLSQERTKCTREEFALWAVRRVPDKKGLRSTTTPSPLKKLKKKNGKKKAKKKSKSRS